MVMSKAEMEKWKESKTIGYYSGFGGIEVKDIQWGFNDYMIYVAGAWCSTPTVHRTQIKSTAAGDCYIKYHGVMCMLDDFIRA